MLNTLANHGFIPRSGSGITQKMLSDTFVNVLGCSTFFGDLFASVAFGKFVDVKKNPGATLSLDILIKPQEAGGIEHLASLTRADVTRPVAPGTKAGPPLKDRLEGELKLIGKTTDTDVITVADFAKIRKSLETSSTPLIHKAIAAAEACLIMGIGEGPEGKGLTVEFFRAFLENETFPKNWGKSKHWFKSGPLSGFGVVNLIPCMMQLGIDKAMFDSIPYLAGVDKAKF